MTKDEKIAIQRQQMTGFMNYFENNELDFNDTQLLQKMQNAITRIFQLEIEELGYSYKPNRDNSENTFELSFINDPKATFRGQYNSGARLDNGKFIQGKPSIKYNIVALYEDLQSPDKDKRMLACKTLFKTVFHEIQHHRQYMMTRTNVSSKDGMQYARDFAIKQYLHKDWYSSNAKTGNYAAYTIENNANEVGYSQFLETLGREDSEIAKLRDIERGKFNISRYKADVDSWDGQQHYDSNGLQERNDVTVPILDSLIGEKGRTEILQIYPILQKEYNLDGTKKTAVELTKNMQLEVQSISQNQTLTDKDRKKLIQDSQQMYYDLIYRQIEKSTPEQISQIAMQIGKAESKELFDSMSHYFQCELENRLGQSAKMAFAQEKMGDYGFIMSFNNGTIAVEQNGQTVQMAFDEFIKIIDPKLLQRTFDIPAGKDKGEMTAKRFIEKYFFNYLSQNGKVTLQNGQGITAKQYIEQYVLQITEMKADRPPKKFIMETMKSESPWAIQKENCERLEQYYDAKREIIAQVSENVEQFDLAKQDEQKQKRIAAHQRKMNWINEYVKDYNDTEAPTAYAVRTNCEDENIKRVLESIKTGKFIENFDNNAEKCKDDPSWYMGKVVPSMARLIKAAQSLTIDGGVNYVEKFTAIPEVNKILVQIRDDEYSKQRHNEAEKNRRTGNLPKYRRTRAEIDRQYAQDYLRSGNLSQGSVQSEIDYRRGLTTRNLLKVSDEVEKKNILMLRRQQISLSRVLARQDGKTPSEVFYDEKRKGWYCITDTQAEQKKTQSQSVPKTTSSYDMNIISPSDVADSTIRVGTGTQDINAVAQEIRRTQTRDLQQAQENYELKR